MSTPPDRDHVTLFKGAADNPYFEVYFNAQLVERAERVRSEIHAPPRPRHSALRSTTRPRRSRSS